MIIDLKYHIASLIAVFMALGIGILIGSTVLSNNVNDVIVQQQKQMVDNIKKDFDDIRKENQAVRAEIETYKASLNISKEFEKQILPVVVSGKLSDKKIAIIETSNYGFHEEWINTLKMAGAQVTSITSVTEGFDLKDAEKQRQIGTKLMLEDLSENNILKEFAKEIAGGILTAQNLENIKYFEQLDLIKTEGELGIPVDAVVFVGGSQAEIGERVKNFDLSIMKYFLAQNIPVYGVETSDVMFSYMKDYQTLKITTVDNIDMVPGQVALVLAINGKPGNFGIKSTASQILPDLE